jgi:hypothetical protein
VEGREERDHPEEEDQRRRRDEKWRKADKRVLSILE